MAFAAKFPGKCVTCSGRIAVGDRIGGSARNYSHVGCLAAAPAPEAPATEDDDNAPAPAPEPQGSEAWRQWCATTTEKDWITW